MNEQQQPNPMMGVPTRRKKYKTWQTGKTIWKRSQRLDIGAMLPQAKEYLESPQSRRGKHSPLEAWEGAWDCWYLNFGPTVPGKWEKKFIFF